MPFGAGDAAAVRRRKIEPQVAVAALTEYAVGMRAAMLFTAVISAACSSERARPSTFGDASAAAGGGAGDDAVDAGNADCGDDDPSDGSFIDLTPDDAGCPDPCFNPCWGLCGSFLCCGAPIYCADCYDGVCDAPRHRCVPEACVVE